MARRFANCPYTTTNPSAQAMQFDFNEEKNQLLLRERGVTILIDQEEQDLFEALEQMDKKIWVVFMTSDRDYIGR